MLQALRGVISGAGQKMGEAVRKTLIATLLSLLGMPEVCHLKVDLGLREMSRK